MESKIKKCPFCGADGELHWICGRYGYFVFVQCSLCGGQGKTISIGKELPENWEDSSQSNNAVKAWNMRVKDNG